MPVNATVRQTSYQYSFKNIVFRSLYTLLEFREEKGDVTFATIDSQQTYIEL